MVGLSFIMIVVKLSQMLKCSLHDHWFVVGRVLNLSLISTIQISHSRIKLLICYFDLSTYLPMSIELLMNCCELLWLSYEYKSEVLIETAFHAMRAQSWKSIDNNNQRQPWLFLVVNKTVYIFDFSSDFAEKNVSWIGPTFSLCSSFSSGSLCDSYVWISLTVCLSRHSILNSYLIIEEILIYRIWQEELCHAGTLMLQ